MLPLKFHVYIICQFVSFYRQNIHTSEVTVKTVMFSRPSQLSQLLTAIFRNTLLAVTKCRCFSFPSWISILREPAVVGENEKAKNSLQVCAPPHPTPTPHPPPQCLVYSPLFALLTKASQHTHTVDSLYAPPPFTTHRPAFPLFSSVSLSSRYFSPSISFPPLFLRGPLPPTPPPPPHSSSSIFSPHPYLLSAAPLHPRRLSQRCPVRCCKRGCFDLTLAFYCTSSAAGSPVGSSRVGVC